MIMKEGRRLSTILRRPEGLFAILTLRKYPFERPVPSKDKNEADKLASGESGPYIGEIVPLAEVPETVVPEKGLLIRSWETIGSVEALNSEVLASMLYVLSQTVPDTLTDLIELPPLVLKESSSLPRPTAAHPRAYRGTKYKPPKPVKPDSLNLQGYLCSVPDICRLFAKMDPFFEKAIEQLAETSTCRSSFLAERDRSPLNYEQWRTPEYQKRVSSLPATFHRNLLWNFRGSNWETIAAALSIFWALGLDEDETLMHCVTNLLTMQPVRQMLDWCRAASRMPPARRVDFIELLIESGAYSIAPNKEITAGLLKADSLSNDPVYRHRMFYVLCNIREGYGLSYANDGLLLANLYHEHYVFDEIASLDGVAAAVISVAEYVSNCDSWYKTIPLHLWKRCSELKGYIDLLETLNWGSLDPQSVYKFFTILGDVVYEELPENKLLEKWEVIRQQADNLLQIVVTADIEFCPKVLDGLSSILWVVEDAKKLTKVLGPFCSLLMRLCRPPFKQNDLVNYPLTAFTALPAEEWATIENAEDRLFIKLESATARKNEASLIGRGLWSMCDIIPRLSVDGFVGFTQQLLKTAQTLGVLEVPIRREILRSFTLHPLACINPSLLEAEDLLALVEEYLRPGVADPVTKRLREHVKGIKPLQPAQIERDVGLIRDKWLAMQLGVLNQAAFDQMSMGMPLAQRTSKVQHALMLQQLAEEHRRSLRRLLKAYLNGHDRYAVQHPKNREWLSKHPKINNTKWTEGIALRSEVKGHGEVNLSIEGDPLEVLRLGSYFGTCLGIGGWLSYSAAAITLDINKQVIYARTATGRAIARQLIAIADNDTLICFSVYPTSSSNDIYGLFRDYDLQLADYLGLEIFKGEADEDYEVASIVSSRFWDDGAWDLNIDDRDDNIFEHVS